MARKPRVFAPKPAPPPELTGHHKLLAEVLVEQMGVDEREITLDSSFADDLGCDSLDGIEIVMTLEERLGIEIIDEAPFMEAKTVGAVVELLNQLAPEKA